MPSITFIIVDFICPALGTILANALFAAPVNSLKHAITIGSLGELNPLPWAFMTGNCAGWVAYSYLTSDIFVFLANGPGILLSIWLNIGAAKLQYLHQYSERRERREREHDDDDDDERRDGDMILGEENHITTTTTTTQYYLTHQEKAVLSVVLLWITIFTTIHFSPISHKQRELTVGIIVNLNFIFFLGAPLSTIATVLRTRDSSSIHRGTMIMGILNCTFWFIYGLAIFDVFIYLPNGTGLCLSLLQGLLYGCFPRRGIYFEKRSSDVAVVVAGNDVCEELVDEGDNRLT